MPGTIVWFPLLPLKDEIISGIRKDVEHFRFMVGQLLLQNVRVNNDTNAFMDLPGEFNLFFSEIFIHPLSNLQDTLELSFYQLYHPIFFGVEHRVKFLELLVQYRKYDKTFFDENLGLDSVEYGVNDWHITLPNVNDFHLVLKRALHDRSQAGQFDGNVPIPKKFRNSESMLPRFLRNVYNHHRDYSKVCIH